MEINRKNYESWFLDYHEGTLAPEKVAELFAFLEDNTDLRDEFEEFENIGLTADIPAVSFGSKDALHRNELNDEEIRILMLDVLEGNAPSRREELMQLLTNRPALSAEWNVLQQTILPASDVTFKDKSILLKNAALPQGYDQLLIAAMEGDLTLQQHVELNSLLAAHPALGVEKELFSKTRITAEAVVFEGKDKLKKKEAKVIAFNYSYALRIAAAVIILLGAAFLFNREANQPEQVAVIKPTIPAVIQSQVPSTVTPSQTDKKGVNQPGKVIKNNTTVTPVSTESGLANNTGSDKANGNKHSKPVQPSDTSSPVVTQDHEEALAFIEPLPMKQGTVSQEEPFADVQRRHYFSKLPASTEENLAMQPQTFVKEVVSTATETVEKVTENTPLSADVNGTQLTLGSRAIRSLAWVIGKASDNRIQIKTTFNPVTGSLAAYEVETANRRWQKQF